MKIVINTDYGGFGLSNEAIHEYCLRKGLNEVSYYDIPRNDIDLVEIVESLGSRANTRVSSLKIVEIPNDVDWQIEEYDGMEWVAEKHRTWR